MANFDSQELISGISGSILSSFEAGVTNVDIRIAGNVRRIEETLVITGSSTSGGSFLIPIYRSFVGGEYVYTENSPAPGFVFTSIVGFK